MGPSKFYPCCKRVQAVSIHVKGAGGGGVHNLYRLEGGGGGGGAKSI